MQMLPEAMYNLYDHFSLLNICLAASFSWKKSTVFSNLSEIWHNEKGKIMNGMLAQLLLMDILIPWAFQIGFVHKAKQSQRDTLARL